MVNVFGSDSTGEEGNLENLQVLRNVMALRLLYLRMRIRFIAWELIIYKRPS